MNETSLHEVVVGRRVAYRPWWARFASAAESVVRTIPTHRDSRSGRRNAMQIRVGLLVVGILTVVFWESDYSLLGLIPALCGLFVPLPEGKRRTILARLKTSRTGHKRIVREAAALEIEPNHVTLLLDGERLRRLRRKDVTFDDSGGEVRLSAGKKGTDQLVLVGIGEAPDDVDLWVEVDAVPPALLA